MKPTSRLAAVLTAVALFLAACGAERQASADSPVMSFTATTLQGQRLDGSSLSGRPVVLWFWTPWCTICRAEAPDVVAVAAELTGEVTFLGVPGRGPVEHMRAFVVDTGTGDMQHLVDSDGSLWRRFGVVSQPSFVFIDSAGVAELFGGALDGDQLREAAGRLTTGR